MSSHDQATRPRAEPPLHETHRASPEATASPAGVAVEPGAVGGGHDRGAPALSQWAEGAGAERPAHERVTDQILGPTPGLVPGDMEKLLTHLNSGDTAAFSAFVRTFSADYRGKIKQELIRRHRFDRMPLPLQAQLSPESPYHQESQVDGGAISCTSAVRIEGVTAEDALRALTQTDWKQWWATSSTSGPPPSFDFVPEAPLRAIPGFHLHVQMGAAVPEGKGYRLPARLAGTFSGSAEMYIEGVEGGVVVHDTWMGMRLSNWTMEHAGGAAFWTKGHLEALRGAMFGGMLGNTGFAGLRQHLLGQRR